MTNDPISRSALLKVIEDRYVSALVQVNTRRTGKTIHQGIACGMNFARNVILEQPTVDAEPVINGDTSDGYHTFNELYHHRAVLFSVVVKAFPNKAWKAKKHHDGSMFEGMFIVGIETPDGQATYHYDIDPYWDMLRCKEIEFAPEWDGHTPQQAIERIGKLNPVRHGKWIGHGSRTTLKCSECGKWQPAYYHDPWSYCPNCGAKMEAHNKAKQEGRQ